MEYKTKAFDKAVSFFEIDKMSIEDRNKALLILSNVTEEVKENEELEGEQ